MKNQEIIAQMTLEEKCCLLSGKGSGGQTGIGMALSREYMRLMGGDVAVAVHEGKTEFTVSWQISFCGRSEIFRMGKHGSPMQISSGIEK